MFESPILGTLVALPTYPSFYLFKIRQTKKKKKKQNILETHVMEYDTWLIYLLKRNKRRSYHDLGYITQKNSLNGTCQTP